MIAWGAGCSAGLEGRTSANAASPLIHTCTVSLVKPAAPYTTRGVPSACCCRWVGTQWCSCSDVGARERGGEERVGVVGGGGAGGGGSTPGAQRHAHSPSVPRPQSHVFEERNSARHAQHLRMLPEERRQVLNRHDGNVAVAVRVRARLSAQQDSIARCCPVHLELHHDLQCKAFV